MSREALSGGVIRLTADRVCFLFERLKPGVMLTSCRGRDAGGLGKEPLAIIERERGLFNSPVLWFFDASRVQGAAIAVSDTWTAWLRAHAGTLEHLHVLTGSNAANLTINVARHFSDSHGRMTVYPNRADWMRSLDKVAGCSTSGDLGARFDEAPISLTRTEAGGEVHLEAPGSAWLFRTIQRDALFCEFSGDDSGDLTDLALDEMERALSHSSGKLHWFLDLRHAGNVSARVSQTWTEWLGVNRERFARISAFAVEPLFPLVLTVASYRSRVESLVHIYRDADAFGRELASVAEPGERKSTL